MKIGILTFHAAHNYGAVLQAYGLQEHLRNCGHEVEIIDYRPEYLLAGYRALSFPNFQDTNSIYKKLRRIAWWGLFLLKRLPSLPVRLLRRRKFEKFISGKLRLSKEQYSMGQAPKEKYDAIIFGSDQIWSPNHTKGGDPIFVGDFPTPAGTLKIAYAASAGASSSSLGENLFFTKALKNFSSISVRESALAEALQPKTEQKIEVVLDPSLLVDKSVWDALAIPPPASQKKYVLLYQVSYEPRADAIAKDIAQQIGAEVVSIWAGYTLHGNMKKCESPEQFVGWFKNAACVVSTSFHGTAFGLIFEKPLYYVGNGNAGENRPRQILNALGLMERYISIDAPSPKFSEIDYSSIRNGGGYIKATKPLPKISFRRIGVSFPYSQEKKARWGNCLDGLFCGSVSQDERSAA